MINKKNLLILTLIASSVLFASCADSANDSQFDLEESGQIISESSEANTESHEKDSSDYISEEPVSVESTASEEEESSEDFGSVMAETEVSLDTYTNFLMDGYKSQGAWQEYGFGDPFVMRYNGKYYLYPSTMDGKREVKVWESDNLVNWKYRGICATGDAVYSAYAPEVVYYNGSFYMYTSPAGTGHYVLKASSPLGPFTPITGNLGNSIDGHVFIDDNGEWYFYHADFGDVKGKLMSSPSDLSARDIGIGATVNDDWSEGPMVIKRNGIYYLTYCGNHVWSRGYRIEGAYSKTSPVQFTDISGNILMVNTEDPFYGIGHSSTVLGPDLDTYYIAYHTFSIPGRRRFHIDALAFNGTDFCALGPTTTKQQVPKLPEIYTRFESKSDSFVYEDAKISNKKLVISDGGRILTQNIISGDKYTAETNFYNIKGNAGFVFSYTNDKNYSTAILNTTNQSLVVTIFKDGASISETELSLPRSFDKDVNFSSLQCLRITKDGDLYTFYFNGLNLGNVEADLPEGRFGIISMGNTASVGYTAISYNANGSSLKTYYKPIEGEIYAITSVEEGNPTLMSGSYYQVMKENYVLNYYVNVESKNLYDLDIAYSSNRESEMEIYRGGKLIKRITLPSTKRALNHFSVRNLTLDEGFGIISFKITKGNANILSYTFTKSVLPTDGIIKLSDHLYIDGSWKVSGDRLYLDQNNGSNVSHGKVVYGNYNWNDYSVSADFKFDSEFNGSLVGLLVRATNPALAGSGDDSMLGRSFVQGYFVTFKRRSSIDIHEINYVRTEPIVSFPIDIDLEESCNLRVEVIGNEIRVYLNDEYLGKYIDMKTPFLNGGVGFTALKEKCDITNLQVEKITEFTEN